MSELARAVDTKGFAVSIDSEVFAYHSFPFGKRRQGTKYITSPEGQTVRAGYWMDFPEEHWPITETGYYELAREERAAMECVEQASRYDLAEEFAHFQEERRAK